jgi:pyruvate/2-oxoglutarate dehydrogenase complex dihydrolipoamide acyltransferase (E2) component
MSNVRGTYAITVPELGLGPCPITVSLWLVPHGARVRRGDRVVELMAGDATVDLSAPVTGVLIRRDAREDDQVAPRQVIGWIRPPGAAGCVDGGV